MKEKKLCPVCKTKPVKTGKTCGRKCGYAYRGQRQLASGDVADGAAAKDSGEVHDKRDGKWDISIPPQGRIKSLDQLIEHCRIDTAEWAIDRHVINKWEVGAKHPTTGEIIVEPLYQVKAWLVRKKEVVAARAEIEAMRKTAAKWALRPARAPRRTKRGNLLEISITDHHFGSLAWGAETGWEDYDLGIADRTPRGVRDTA